MLDTRLRKAWKDLLLRKARSLLVVAGLAVGLWGLGTVVVAYVILANDLRQNFVDTNPPSIVVETDLLTPAQRRALAAVPGVARIENRPLVGGRIEVSEGTWLPLLLQVVEDFEAVEVARFYPESGAWPPPPGTLLIERDGRALSSILRSRSGAPPGPHSSGAGGSEGRASGEGMRVRLTGAPAVPVAVSGTVFDPGQAPSRMELAIYGYASADTAAHLGVRPEESRLLVTVSGDPEDADGVQGVAAALAGELERQGVESRRWRIPEYQHPHQFQMSSVLVLLGSLGLLALLMGAVLVVNLVSALLASQIRQIGVMKAIGASTGQVMTSYLAAMALLGAATAAVAVPFSLSSGRGVARWVSRFLNFELLTLALPWWLPAALALVGILFPVAAALLPVWRGSRITVLQALGSHGISGGGPGAGAGRRLPLPVALAMAVRNTFRQRRRLVMTCLTLAVGTTAYMVALNMRTSLLETADTVERTNRYDVALALGETYQDQGLERWVEGIDGVGRVELWKASAGRIGPVGGEAAGNAVALRIVPTGSRAVDPYVTDGRWLDDAEPAGIVANHKLLADRPGLAVGRDYSLEVEGESLEVRLIGVVKEFGPAVIYMPAPLYESRVGRAQRSNLMLISLAERSGTARRALRQELERRIAHSNLDVKRLLTSTMAALIIRGHLDVIAATLAFVALLMMLVSGLGVASSLGVSVTERSREIGVLRAIGGRGWTVLWMLVCEAVVVGAIAWTAAAVVAAPVSRAAAALFGTLVVEYPFDYRTSYGGMALALAVALGLAIAASLGAARRATRQPVRDALSYE